MNDDAIRGWKEGADVIEGCLAKAVRAEHSDAPFPLDEAQAKLWHQAQAEAYRHALEMMAPSGHEPGRTEALVTRRGGAADGGDLGPFGGPGVGKSMAVRNPGRTEAAATSPTSDQFDAIERIVTGYRTIIAGAPGTGRTTLATLAALAWGAGRHGDDPRPALLVVRDEATRMDIVMRDDMTSRGVVVHTHQDVEILREPSAFLGRHGLILVDDADAGAGLTPAADIVVRQANTSRVVRLVCSGRNDDDATIVLKQVLRQAA